MMSCAIWPPMKQGENLDTDLGDAAIGILPCRTMLHIGRRHLSETCGMDEQIRFCAPAAQTRGPNVRFFRDTGWSLIGDFLTSPTVMSWAPRLRSRPGRARFPRQSHEQPVRLRTCDVQTLSLKCQFSSSSSLAPQQNHSAQQWQASAAPFFASITPRHRLS